MSEEPIQIHSELSSDGSKEYIVKMFETFSTCTCEGFKHRKTCRHIKKHLNKSFKPLSHKFKQR